MIHCIQPHFHTGIPIPISIPLPMSIATDPSSANAAEHGCAEFMLFGVRVKIDPMRKCVSMNNLSDYSATNPTEKSTHEFPKSTAAVGSSAAGVGYASADDVARLPSSRRRDCKRGVPWTEEEHKLFLIGLQEVGKGEWRGISKNYVKTRTPTQVASHAQKYFIRQSNMKRRRQRSSLFDMTTVSITSMAMEERKTQQDSPAIGFPIAPFPLASSHIQSSMQHGNIIESAECYRGINPSSAAMFVNPAPILPSPTYSSTLDLNIDDSVPPLSLTLSLAPRQDPASTPEPIFQAIPGFKSGSNIISVS